MSLQMLDFCGLGRGTKPNIIDGALPNLPKTELFVQALINTVTSIIEIFSRVNNLVLGLRRAQPSRDLRF
jgi:hypothetical protein